MPSSLDHANDTYHNSLLMLHSRNDYDDISTTTDSITTADLQKPILVGYAFGPKKMSTMATVMAEASRARVVGVVVEEEESPRATPMGGFESGLYSGEDRLASLTQAALSKHELSQAHSEENFVCRANDRRHNKNKTNCHFHHHKPHTAVVGGNLNNIVRYFRSSCSSVDSENDDDWGSMTSTSHSWTVGNYPVRVSFVPVDLNEPLEEQHGGMFDVILHKMTEDILCLSTAALQQDENNKVFSSCTSTEMNSFDDVNNEELRQARDRIHRLTTYQELHPNCCLADDPTNVQVVMSRSAISVKLQLALVGVTSASGLPVQTPRFLNYQTKGGVHSLSYPLIAKPLPAAGTKKSHCMGIVLNPSGLDSVQLPCLLQEYANHDAVLHKVYVLGDSTHVFLRPSLPNLPTEASELENVSRPYVEFDSQRPYPSPQDFGLDAMTLEENSSSSLSSCGSSHQASSLPVVSALTSSEVAPLVKALKRAFGLQLFGFDILVSSGTLLVVDVNYFPSFKEVSNFPSLLAKFLVQRAVQKRKACSSTTTATDGR